MRHWCIIAYERKNQINLYAIDIHFESNKKTVTQSIVPFGNTE